MYVKLCSVLSVFNAYSPYQQVFCKMQQCQNCSNYAVTSQQQGSRLLTSGLPANPVYTL